MHTTGVHFTNPTFYQPSIYTKACLIRYIHIKLSDLITSPYSNFNGAFSNRLAQNRQTMKKISNIEKHMSTLRKMYSIS